VGMKKGDYTEAGRGNLATFFMTLLRRSSFSASRDADDRP
jgi:hypothetical protein